MPNFCPHSNIVVIPETLLAGDLLTVPLKEAGPEIK
jgi:hypothetical protein